MNNQSKINSQCQNDLDTKGFSTLNLVLSKEILSAVQTENYNNLDQLIANETAPGGLIFNVMKEFCAVKEIEFIISLREAKNDWEEDGIWHDDGSRIMAFSLSLTLNKPEGGFLEFRKKGNDSTQKIATPEYGEMIIFKTGIDNYEHKINRVTKGARLIIAGWCYP